MGDSENMYDTGSAAGGGNTPATPAAGASAPATGTGLTTAPSLATARSSAQPSQTSDTLTPPERALKSESWGNKLYHGILNALGGSGDVAYSRDPKTGKMTATPVKVGPGTQWKRIVAGALSGFSAAAQAGGTGPGSGMRAAGAGIQAGFQSGRQQYERKRAEANEDYEAQQKAATQQASLALLNHQIAKSTFDLGRAKVTAAVEDSDRETNFEKVIGDGGDGSIDMGNFPDFAAVMKAFKDAPQLHDHQAGGRIISIPHINGDGKVDGVHAALVTPTWLESKINRDLPITVRGYKDGKMQEETFTIPKGSLTGAQYSQMVMAQSKDALDDWTKTTQMEIEKGKAKAEEAKDYAAADKDRIEAKALNEATDQNTISSNAQQLVEGSMDPSNLSKRSKSYDPTLAAANAYSMKTYGHPFDIAKAMGDYKFATNTQTYNTLNFLNSLTGRDNQSGNLGEVIRLSDQIKRSDFPAINAVAQWASISAGHPEYVALHTALLESADQAAKILQGGGSGSGGTSDKKLQQTIDLLNQNFNAKQMRAAVLELRPLLANRKNEIIGDNRYLQQWHGVPAQPGGGPAAQPAASGAAATPQPPIKVQPGEPTAKGGNGETLVVRNGKWVAAQP